MYRRTIRGRDGLGVLGPQLLLVDLAGGKHRQLVGHEHVPWRLVPCQPRPHVLLQVKALYYSASGGDDDRADRLAPLVVGHADDGDRADRGVREQALLDLQRVDVLPAGDDHVLLAVDQVEQPVGVKRADVAGVAPAVAQDLGRGGAVVPVPAEHGGRPPAHPAAILTSLPGNGMPTERSRRRERSSPSATWNSRGNPVETTSVCPYRFRNPAAGIARIAAASVGPVIGAAE